jgi:hypothetical protein
MIPDNKMNNALAALNAVFVTARKLAYDQRPHQQIAEVLDATEYLSRLLAEKEDQTAAFRETLVGLITLDPGFGFAIERFDNEHLDRWVMMRTSLW